MVLHYSGRAHSDRRVVQGMSDQDPEISETGTARERRGRVRGGRERDGGSVREKAGKSKGTLIQKPPPA